MPENVYANLLYEFREAAARFNEEMFYLVAVSEEEYRRDPAEYEENVPHVGFIMTHLDHAGEAAGIHFHAPAFKVGPDGHKSQCKAPYLAFMALAARAGAHLPYEIELSLLPWVPGDKVSLWLAFVWRKSLPPPQEPIPPEGIDASGRPFKWSEPFADSARAIEICGLIEHYEQELDKLHPAPAPQSAPTSPTPEQGIPPTDDDAPKWITQTEAAGIFERELGIQHPLARVSQEIKKQNIRAREDGKVLEWQVVQRVWNIKKRKGLLRKEGDIQEKSTLPESASGLCKRCGLARDQLFNGYCRICLEKDDS